MDTTEEHELNRSIEVEHEKFLTELRHTYQALEGQASALERLTQEVMSMKGLLSIEASVHDPSKPIAGDAAYETQRKTILKIRSFLVSFVAGLKKNDGIRNSYTYEMALLDSYLEELEARSVGQICGSNSLSLRELRILSMIKVGMTTELIAERLHISSDTVKTHRRNIRRKLDIVGKGNSLASLLREVVVAEAPGTSRDDSGDRAKVAPVTQRARLRR
jgi:DNA-binding CsgD family transcriptional regulator